MQTSADVCRCLAGKARFPEFSHGTQSFRACNLVLQGGGVHGAALTGFVKELEEDGFRFVGIAGASAGAIVAMGMVGARNQIIDKSGDALLDLLNSLPALSFIDGPQPIRKLLKSFLGGKPWDPMASVYAMWLAWRRILIRRGLNPGDRFENWLAMELRDRFGLRTANDLNRRLTDHAQQWRDSLNPTDQETAARGIPNQLLKLMAAALPIGIKLELPENAEFIDYDPEMTNPAWFVRMSMSVPYFFEPVRIRLRRHHWKQYLQILDQTLFHAEDIRRAGTYEQLSVVDGGLFSNLPLYAFEPESRYIPTIAVSLLVENDPGGHKLPKPTYRRKTSAVLSEVLAAVSAMKAQRDRDAWLSIRQSDAPPAIHVASIDMTGHNWLNFTVSRDNLLEMHERGRRAARSFIGQLLL